ncbi:MAG TPA: YccF domain-containing protein [Ornithinibacter sp.]|nr:YccF domain-containing protein [Ornithinibacter sp.]
MRTLLNIIWLVFGGLWLALGYALAGVILCILIITIPLGVASFRMASYALWPFGRAVVRQPDAGAGSVVLNVVWIVLAGWWLALEHVVTAVAQAITIIGIPLAIANLKMIPISLFPYGKRIVPADSLAPGDRPLHSI